MVKILKKSVIVTVGLVFSCFAGKVIETKVNNSSMSVEDKVMANFIACTLTGGIIGLVARRIIKSF